MYLIVYIVPVYHTEEGDFVYLAPRKRDHEMKRVSQYP